VALGDVDGDTDLDAFVTNNFPDANTVWLNDGSGSFSNSGQQLGSTTSYDVALADLDGDGDLDAFVANFGPNAVYSNGPPGLPGAAFDIDRATNPLGQEVYYWAQEGDAQLAVLLSAAAPQALDVLLRADAVTGVMTDTLTFTAGEQVKPATITNPAPDPSEEIDLTLFVEQPSNPTDNVLLFFVDGEQGEKGCILCYLDWLAKLLGFDPGFVSLHHADFSGQQQSPQWQYYTDLFGFYSPEMTEIIARHPMLLWDSLEMLHGFTPGALALAGGNGDQVVVTQTLVDDTIGLFAGVASHASPDLQQAIQRELAVLDLPSFVGLNMNEAWETLVARVPAEQKFLPSITN
jgi:hypothetical protein